MLTLSNDDDVKPIAKVEISPKKYEILGIVDPDNTKIKSSKTFTTYSTKSLQPIPDPSNRFVAYVAGPSGSGKSTYVADLGLQYKKIFPKNKIFIFSRTEAIDDPAYKKLQPEQIEINDDMLENPIDITKEVGPEGCLVIFDDTETINNVFLKEAIQLLIMDILEVGRKLKINCIITNHLIIPTKKNFARTVLNEAQTVTLFPKSGCAGMDYVLDKYFGINKKTIKKIRELPSRWVTVSKSYPMYVLYNKGAFIL